MTRKSKPIQKMNQDTLKNHYWLKSDLIAYCSKNELSVIGSKQELIQRIEVFLKTGNRIKLFVNKVTGRDSDQLITKETLVVNYKNDAATRQFFMKHIGQHFRFDTYLRQFTNKNNITKGLTYGDLITGWLLEESKRKNPNYQTKIASQFEYNQFIRDFFSNEKGKSQSDAIKAWEITKTLRGSKTYANYKSAYKQL